MKKLITLFVVKLMITTGAFACYPTDYDKVQDQNLATETTNRIAGDNNLQTEINNLGIINTNSTTVLQNNINNVVTNQTAVNTNVATSINETNTAVTNLNSTVISNQTIQNNVNNVVNNHLNAEDKEIRDLQQTKVIVEGVIRLLDTKRFAVEVFDSYDVRHGDNSMVGTRLVWKLGKNYEDKKNAEMLKALREQWDFIEMQINRLQSRVEPQVLGKQPGDR